MASVDVPVALLGYGTVGAAINRLLSENGDEIERATGHRLRVVRALVRDTSASARLPRGRRRPDHRVRRRSSTTRRWRSSPRSWAASSRRAATCSNCSAAGKPVVTANKQLLARRSAELFATASEAGVQLRFEASVCAAIPVIKVLRESLVVTNVHRVLGIVNGTTNFILTRMEAGSGYEDSLAEAQRLGYAEADPTEDVSGADAAAKMAILATVAFGSRVPLEEVTYEGIEDVTGARGSRARARHGDPARRHRNSRRRRRRRSRRPALVDRRHPLAAVQGPFNAVMLHGDAIREVTLEGPGAGGIETASAVVADMVSVLGTTGTGFLQNDPCWRELPVLPPGGSSRLLRPHPRARPAGSTRRTSPSSWPRRASRSPVSCSTSSTDPPRSTS